ncbi:MAG TPA: methylmalonyl Co-A mutase-associated GTPase MeaB [Flavobacteriaceae bacterium]|nr:methylmalonyl Co-A mutase-associated GTPase MeaB [Flavobacteriaceae bacterium]MCB9213684.1 methylmalonyl Co-A mutase-associated GTPase MeaB [Alteromonas sp.]HPF12186.1 methylmalonyl Co-A mutase-associated GTPase MeaB [Flavobacteriaceae bacterium]HQU22319.1 methylmalonyl Co-A mutase-associated GTPase MeaB [Flavobacteriaceae bacterium]HQU66182.1 methylmalonyl Co-A mutase-associated GTPase MeaB [Flavobacteriaceae bacterium]
MGTPPKHASALQEKEGIPHPSSANEASAKKIQERRRKPLSIRELAQELLQGNPMALSRGITLIESTAAKHQKDAKELIQTCLPHANASIRIGITGVPGVGKSTFIESFGTFLTNQGKKVAVLAVDPTSTLSKGSILGDKTRMEDLVKNPKAFIRPSASGESLGGVARKTREAMVLCEAAGYDVILIETVGVGQSETAVHSMTDFFLLLKLAGAGDELQGIKRGIMEMADAIVINKADGENVKAAKLAQAEFNRALHLYPEKESGWTPKTLTCSSLKNEGIQEVWELIETYVKGVKKNGYFQQKRNEQNQFWLKQTIEGQLKDQFYDNPKVQKALEQQLQLLSENKTTPFEAAEVLLSLTK